MKIYIGSDHAGYTLKEEIKTDLTSLGYEVEDLGTNSSESCDYPDYALKVAEAVVKNNARGILICHTGIGMSIAANKVPGIRASLCHNEYAAEMTRRHNNSNILCLSAHDTNKKQASKIMDIWLKTEFEGDTMEGMRHKRRVDIFKKIEKRYLFSTQWSPRGYTRIPLNSGSATARTETRSVPNKYEKRHSK